MPVGARLRLCTILVYEELPRQLFAVRILRPEDSVSPFDVPPAGACVAAHQPALPEPVLAPASGRVAWIDYARGAAIILVVYGHCFRGLLDAGYVDPGSPLRGVDFIIYGFHMPLFFFLSGVVSAKAFNQPFGTFLRGRAISLGWPYLLWMSVEAALLLSLSGLTNMGPPKLGFATYLYQPLSPFWFLYALLAASLIIYALRQLSAPARLGVTMGLYVGCQFVPVEIVRLGSWGLFYLCLGQCCAGWIRRKQVVARMAAPGTLVLLGAATVLLSLGLWHFGCDYRFEVPVAVTGSAMVFGCAERLALAGRRWPAMRLVELLGQISLTVLVVHVLGTAGMRIALSKLLHLHMVWLNLAAGTAAGLALPLALQLASDRLGLLAMFGLPARPRLHARG